MNDNPYKRLAQRLDELPNGFPPTDDGAELRLLAKLFTPEQATLCADLRLGLETADEIAARTSTDGRVVRRQLKDMARRGLIHAGKTERGLGYGLMPFVVGFYEHQVEAIDAEFARLFEDYYQQAFKRVLAVRPALHRVIPINQSIRTDVEIQPFESAAEIVNRAKAWGVLDCICRKQKALIGDPCHHPVDVCMAMSEVEGAFDRSTVIRAMSREDALETLRRAAEAGLVHTVSNQQEDHWYICNCCTCSCGILRGIAEMGVPTAVARSAFVNQVDEPRCIACGECVEVCPFGAMSVDEVAAVNQARCVGCGVCVVTCPQEALHLTRRPGSEVEPPPPSQEDWRKQRAAAREIELDRVL